METVDRCPPSVKEVAEVYCMGALPPSEAMVFEDHYLTCPRLVQ